MALIVMYQAYPQSAVMSFMRHYGERCDRLKAEGQRVLLCAFAIHSKCGKNPSD